MAIISKVLFALQVTTKTSALSLSKTRFGSHTSLYASQRRTFRRENTPYPSSSEDENENDDRPPPSYEWHTHSSLPQMQDLHLTSSGEIEVQIDHDSEDGDEEEEVVLELQNLNLNSMSIPQTTTCKFCKNTFPFSQIFKRIFDKNFIFKIEATCPNKHCNHFWLAEDQELFKIQVKNYFKKLQKTKKVFNRLNEIFLISKRKRIAWYCISRKFLDYHEERKIKDDCCFDSCHRKSKLCCWTIIVTTVALIVFLCLGVGGF